MSIARWLETDSLSNQNISSAAVVGAYTADADRMVICDVSLDQVAGGGDYAVYLTRQINGAGSAYVLLPKTTCTAAAGETALAMQSGMVSVRSGDVLTVYLDGLAGDTTTPDTTVRWFELAALQPTTPGRTLVVDGFGQVTVGAMASGTVTAAAIATGAIDADALAADVGTEISSAVLSALGSAGNLDSQLGAIPTAAENAAEVDTVLSAAHGANSWEGLTAQETRDSAKLAPSSGSPAAGSIDAHLDEIAVIGANVDAIKAVTDDLDVTAVTQVAASNAGHLTITAGLTFDESVSGLTISADWWAAIWTLKANVRDADTAALVQLRVTNPAAVTDGLQRVNGAAPAAPITAADGELSVNQAGGSITIWLSDELTALLAAAVDLGWDVKFIDLADDSSGQRGTADVVLTETRATT